MSQPLPFPGSPTAGAIAANNDAASKFRELLQLVAQEFEALQQHHEAVVKQQRCFTQMARSGMDIDEACQGGVGDGISWPVLNFDCDADETQIHVKKESVGSLLSLMQQSAESPTKDLPLKCHNDGTLRGLAGDPARPSFDGFSPRRPPLSLACIEEGSAPSMSPAALKRSPSPKSPCSKAESNATAGSVTTGLSKTLDGLRTFSRKFATQGSSSSLNSLEHHWIKRCIHKMYHSPWFEASFAVVILMNALVMCAEFQYAGDRLGENLRFKALTNSVGYSMGKGWSNPEAEDRVHQTFDTIEWSFGLIFVLELLFKFAVLGIRVVKDVWNWVDIVTVGFFLFEKTFGSNLPVGSQWMRICRLARLTRLIKLVRTVEGFDHLYLMTTAIKGSVKILAWALALLLLIQTTIALIIGQVLRVTYFEDASKTVEMQHEIYKYFGTCSRSLLSMFEITLANWPPICRLLSEEVSEWFMLLCVVHKLTIGFAVVGVINGVFMQETFKVASTDDIIMVRQKEKAARKHRQSMQELFNGLDNSGDGKVNLKEFCSLADFPTVKAWLASMEIRTDDLDTMFHLMDKDGSGGITFEEMLHGMEKLKGHARSVDLFALLRAANMKDEIPIPSRLEESDGKQET